MSAAFDDDLFDDEELEDDERQPATAGSESADGDTEQAPEPEFSSVYEFVEEHLVYLYARKLAMKNTIRWCPSWFEHAEAVSRLEGLWRAFESLRLDPALGMSTWWRDHADPTMSVLFSSEGPFECCSERGHFTAGETKPLPVEPMSDDSVRAAMSAA